MGVDETNKKEKILMRYTQTTRASYTMRVCLGVRRLDITENDIIVGCDSIGNTWVLMKQTKRREF